MDAISKLLSDSLEIKHPYYIGDIFIDDLNLEITLTIENKNLNALCPSCNQDSKIHDRLSKKWRHIDVFNFKVYITYKTPRVRCNFHGVKLTDVEWAKQRHHFTNEMEKYVYELSKKIPLKHIGSMIDEHDTRVKRIIKGVENEKNNN